jgi:hypothetical protein
MTDADKVIAIDSTWDTNTQLASDFRRQNVHPYLQTKGFGVNELTGSSASREAAEQAASAPGIVYITGVSHGLNDTFTGDQDRPVFETGAYNPATFKAKIVHFLACNTAYYLGRNLVDPGGALAFFGYIGPFTWPSQDDGPYARMFFDCDAEIDRALADGETAGTAGQRAIAKFDQQILALKTLGDAASLYAAAMLEKNRDMLRSPATGSEYGDATAKLRLTRTVPQTTKPRSKSSAG